MRACLVGDTWLHGDRNVAALARNASARVLAETADFHRMSGYARAALQMSDAAPALVTALEPAYYRGVVNHLRALGDLALVDATLASVTVPYAVLKGPVLATQVHARADLRSYVDLDILVPPPYFGVAVEALIAAGCEPMTSAWAALRKVEAGELALALPSGGALDLHWHTLNSPTVRSAFTVDPAALVRRAITADIGAVRAPVLDDADTLVYVAMHAVLSGSHRLLWLKDVDLLVRRGPPWELVAERAREVGGALVVAVALAQVEQTLGTPVPRHARTLLTKLPVWPAIAVLASRWSRPERASTPLPMLSRVVARSTRQGVPSSIVELARRARAAQQPDGIRPGEREDDADPTGGRAAFNGWVDAQLGDGS